MTMNPIQKRLTDIDAELTALRDTLDATATEITTLGDDLTNVTRIGRHLRELGTIAHSYDGVAWLGDVIGVDPGTWAEARDDERRAVSRLEDAIRDRRKSLKNTTDEIKRAISSLEREREAITRAERVIGGGEA
jgi:predicted  nucleic acid-binding Zn-ribbon protein